MTVNQKEHAPILLLGSGRSGTTLIQRILNTYDDVILWGEHDGFVEQLADSYFKVTRSESMFAYSYSNAPEKRHDIFEYKKPEVWQAWSNWFSTKDIKIMYQGLLKSIFFPDDCFNFTFCGFKEIRYGGNDNVVPFFIELFPNTKVIVVIRNELNTIESQITTFHHGTSRFPRIKRLLMIHKIASLALYWKKQNSGLIKLSKLYPENVFVFKYEDLISDNKELSRLVGVIGKTIGDDQEHVLSMKEGRGTGKKGKEMKKTNKRWRQLGLIPVLLIKSITRNSMKTWFPR